VYDKSDESVGSPLHLPNLGYECVPYLRFIMDNYDNLPEVLVLVHADPFEHCPNLANMIQTADERRLVMLSQVFRNFWTDGQPQHPPRHRFGEVFNRMWVRRVVSPLSLCCSDRLRCFCRQREIGFPMPVPLWGSTYFNGQMAVVRDRVLARPRDFYEKFYWLVTDGRNQDAYSWRQRGDGWLECVAFERMWPLVFGEGTIQYREYNATASTVC
jgi:hypothetical protein